MSTNGRSPASDLAGPALLALLLIAAMLAAFCLAPSERTMGDAQRIVYVHVPVAWLGLLAMAAMAVSGVFYLSRRDLSWDHWAQAAGEVGWLCCSLTLITGSLWARRAWGTWWEWDPRLTTSFILWVIYCGILLARGSIDDPHRRARTGAVLAIVGALDVPLVIMATRWFRGLHPVNPQMGPSMRVTLLIGVIAWTLFFVWLTERRRAQVELEHLARDLRRQSDRWASNQGEWRWEH